uniref:Uncharacterized protein n=1 Tax=Nelumbo nucifera TaxID=4432 RepID=A0A822YKH8_NELNU|nr:TPA_asm: hypothetical protein HUJ06_005334 [Nelumbo nucifera]
MTFSSSMSIVEYYLLKRFSRYGGVGISNMIYKIEKNEYMGFENLCKLPSNPNLPVSNL